jgi:hypothetical protein
MLNMTTNCFDDWDVCELAWLEKIMFSRIFVFVFLTATE